MGCVVTDLTAMRFGRLTVVSMAGRNRHRQSLWNCVCDCGGEVIVQGYDLTSGHTSSCGCLRIEVLRAKFGIDLTGRTFGRWTVVERASSTRSGSPRWRCVCLCGTEALVGGYNLRHGRSQSCGCLHKEIMSSRTGELHQAWDPCLTDEDRQATRKYRKYYEWRKAVYERDEYTCRKCEAIGGKLNAHHLNGYAWDEEGRTELDNARTLCVSCHKEFHALYGRGKNTKEQYYEWAGGE